MKKYIGTKTVMARPMSKWEAYEDNFLKAGVVATQEDKNTCGYEVVYDDGYHSWTPKEQFDKAYRLAESPVDRMKIELDELTDRFIKLCKFIQSDRFDTLDEEMQTLLNDQCAAMERYQKDLKLRYQLMTGHPYKP